MTALALNTNEAYAALTAFLDAHAAVQAAVPGGCYNGINDSAAPVYPYITYYDLPSSPTLYTRRRTGRVSLRFLLKAYSPATLTKGPKEAALDALFAVVSALTDATLTVSGWRVDMLRPEGALHGDLDPGQDPPIGMADVTFRMDLYPE